MTLGKYPKEHIQYSNHGESLKSRKQSPICLFFFILLKAIMWVFGCLCMWSILTYRVVQLHRRIYLANMALSYFITKSWVFTNDKLLWLRAQLPPCDSKHFQLDRIETIENSTYLKNALQGGKLYLLKEGIETLPHARRHYIR